MNVLCIQNSTPPPSIFTPRQPSEIYHPQHLINNIFLHPPPNKLFLDKSRSLLYNTSERKKIKKKFTTNTHNLEGGSMPSNQKSQTQESAPSHFVVTVEGEFYSAVPNSRGKTIESYLVEAHIPSMENALSTIKNKLLLQLLKRKYPNATGFRTYEITNVESSSPKKATPPKIKNNIRFMSRKALTTFIEEHGLSIVPSMYTTLSTLRTDIERALDDPEQFEKDNAAFKQEKALEKTLASLNPSPEAA